MSVFLTKEEQYQFILESIICHRLLPKDSLYALENIDLKEFYQFAQEFQLQWRFHRNFIRTFENYEMMSTHYISSLAFCKEIEIVRKLFDFFLLVEKELFVETSGTIQCKHLVGRWSCIDELLGK